MPVTEPAEGNRPLSPAQASFWEPEGTEHSINPRAHCSRMKMLKWWEKSHIPKASTALIPKGPELLEEPKTPQESAAEHSPASAAGKTLGWAAALGGLQRALVERRPSRTPGIGNRIASAGAQRVYTPGEQAGSS